MIQEEAKNAIGVYNTSYIIKFNRDTDMALKNHLSNSRSKPHLLLN